MKLLPTHYTTCDKPLILFPSGRLVWNLAQKTFFGGGGFCMEKVKVSHWARLGAERPLLPPKFSSYWEAQTGLEASIQLGWMGAVGSEKEASIHRPSLSGGWWWGGAESLSGRLALHQNAERSLVNQVGSGLREKVGILGVEDAEENRGIPGNQSQEGRS